MRATALLLLLLGVAALRCSAQFWGSFGGHAPHYRPEPQPLFNGGWPVSGWSKNGKRSVSPNPNEYHPSAQVLDDDPESSVEDSIIFPPANARSDGGGAPWRQEWSRQPPAAPVPGEDQPVLWPNDPSPRRPSGRRPGATRRHPSNPMTDTSRSGNRRTNQPSTTTVRPATDNTSPCGKTIANRIIIGQNATMGQFPWQVGLIYKRGERLSVLCGGALISPSYVLTAAHCINRRDLRGWTLEGVRLGALLSDPTFLETGAMDIGVARQLPHPQYTQNGVRNVRNANDIALLRLDRPAPYTPVIRPVCLPELNQRNSARVNSEPQTYVVAGWGYTEDLVSSPNLKFASLLPEDPEICGQKLQGVTIPSYQLCAIGKNKEDSCDGDSGGPLIASRARSDSNDVVFQVEGIVSFGQRNCLEGNPGAYTRVASYLDWIHQTMQQ